MNAHDDIDQWLELYRPPPPPPLVTTADLAAVLCADSTREALGVIEALVWDRLAGRNLN